MPEAETIRQHEEPEIHTTVLDAYEAVMSLGEASVLSLAMQIWEELRPEQQQEISRTAYGTYPDNLASGERHSRELLILMYVNRTAGEPFNAAGSERIL